MCVCVCVCVFKKINFNVVFPKVNNTISSDIFFVDILVWLIDFNDITTCLRLFYV